MNKNKSNSELQIKKNPYLYSVERDKMILANAKYLIKRIYENAAYIAVNADSTDYTIEEGLENYLESISYRQLVRALFFPHHYTGSTDTILKCKELGITDSAECPITFDKEILEYDELRKI